jgi:hypothetical protein
MNRRDFLQSLTPEAIAAPLAAGMVYPLRQRTKQGLDAALAEIQGTGIPFLLVAKSYQEPGKSL